MAASLSSDVACVHIYIFSLYAFCETFLSFNTINTLFKKSLYNLKHTFRMNVYYSRETKTAHS